LSRPPRTYDSTRRTEQAAATRRRIADSARRLFVERGFAATTIEAIAADAETSAPTIYATYGSKRAILMQLLDDMEVAADRDAARAALAAAAGDPRGEIRVMVDFDVRLFTRAADVIAAVRSAGATDPVFDDIRIEGEARRRRLQAPIVRRWARAGALRKGVSEQEAADVLWAMCGDDLYRLYVREVGWPVERYRTWLYAALVHLLLAAK
jgi:AcrR family transcriptional regulator